MMILKKFEDGVDNSMHTASKLDRSGEGPKTILAL